MARCSMCGGPGVLLGTLGLLRWFTCRNCGWQFSRPVKTRKATKKEK